MTTRSSVRWFVLAIAAGAAVYLPAVAIVLFLHRGDGVGVDPGPGWAAWVLNAMLVGGGLLMMTGLVGGGASAALRLARKHRRRGDDAAP